MTIFSNENINCDKFDPIYLLGERFKKLLFFVAIKIQST